MRKTWQIMDSISTGFQGDKLQSTYHFHVNGMIWKVFQRFLKKNGSEKCDTVDHNLFCTHWSFVGNNQRHRFAAKWNFSKCHPCRVKVTWRKINLRFQPFCSVVLPNVEIKLLQSNFWFQKVWQTYVLRLKMSKLLSKIYLTRES